MYDEWRPPVIAHFKMNGEKRGKVFKVVWFVVILGGIRTRGFNRSSREIFQFVLEKIETRKNSLYDRINDRMSKTLSVLSDHDYPFKNGTG